MADAGYPNGIAKTFNFVVRESPQNRQLAAYAQAEWERLLGVKTRLEVVQVSAMVDRQVAGTFDMISHAACLGGADLGATMRMCYSINKATGKKSDSNFTNFKNAEFDKLLDQFSVEMDAQRKAPAWPAVEPDPQQRDAQHCRVPPTGERTAGTIT